MSLDSIFIVKFEQYLLRFKRKRLRGKTFILFIIHIRKFWGGEERTKNSFNLIRPDECLSP